MILRNLYTYPLKSGLPLIQNSLIGDATGIRGDREFSVIDATTNRVLTARECPGLLSLKIRQTPSGTSLLNTVINSGIDLPKELFDKRIIRIWKRDLECKAFPKEINAWLSHQLGRQVVLCFLSRDDRNIDGFLDTSPIHIVNLASVSRLSLILGEDINHLVFRPNILVDFQRPLIENRCNSVSIGGQRFEVLDTTERCIMVNIVAKNLGVRSADDVLRSIKKLESDAGPINFGIYVRSESSFKIELGMTCEVLENEIEKGEVF